jgi:hypothetical protein
MIAAQWTEQTYTFRSLVPTAFRVKIGETVDVLVDPENPERYSVVSTTSTRMRMRWRNRRYRSADSLCDFEQIHDRDR